MAVERTMSSGDGRGGGGKEKGVEEEAYAGMKSVEELLKLLSRGIHKREDNQQEERGKEKQTEVDVMGEDFRKEADTAVAKFKKVFSLLDQPRIGHARFRRSPSSLSLIIPEEKLTTVQKEGRPEVEAEAEQTQRSPIKVYCPKPIQRFPPLARQRSSKNYSVTPSTLLLGSTTSSSSAFQVMSRPMKRDHLGDEIGDSGNGDRCHCSNRRKTKVRKTVRVSATSTRASDIPSDEFSWRKYGQKPIKGSPFPRGYYKCSTVRGCPARKHVERAVDDPTMIIVSYEADHNHTIHVNRPTQMITAAVSISDTAMDKTFPGEDEGVKTGVKGSGAGASQTNARDRLT